MQTTDQVVELSSGPVFYRDSGGSGTPLVCLHAASGNSMTWEHQIPVFTQAGYRFIAIDYRGVSVPAGPGDWTAQFDALPVDVRELGPSYRAENAEGAARWLHLSHEPPVKWDRPPVKPQPLKPENAVTWPRLEALKLPTLLLTGDADLWTPPSVLRMFARRMPHAETAVIAETGHSSYWESPAEFNRVVLDFLNRH